MYFLIYYVCGCEIERREMDPALVLMLSSLLQLQQSLDAPSLATSTTSAPLLFFTLMAVLAHAVAIFSQQEQEERAHCPWALPTDNPFCSLINEQIWRLDPSIRDSQWRRAYGISYPLFITLVEELKPYINGRTCSIPPDAAVAMVLYRLAHGHSVGRLAAEYGTRPWLIRRLLNLVTKALATKLYPKYVTIPCGQGLLKIIEGFKELTGLPNMCGAIDGSHIKINKQPEKEYNPAHYQCRHHFFAVLLQAVCDHKKVFWDVCVKAPGATEDATHLRESSLFRKLIGGEILLDSVVSIRGNHIRPYIVGDWSYPLLSFLLTPFTTRGTGTLGQNQFDACLMKGRSVIEEALGMLKGRWQILQNLNVSLNHAPQTIVACCVLHNMCILTGEPELAIFPEPWENGPVARPLDGEKSLNYFGESMRQILLEELQEKQQQQHFLLQ